MKIKEIEKKGFEYAALMLYYSITPISKAKFQVHFYNRHIETPASLTLEVIKRDFDNYSDHCITDEVIRKYNLTTMSKVILNFLITI